MIGVVMVGKIMMVTFIRVIMGQDKEQTQQRMGTIIMDYSLQGAKLRITLLTWQ